MKEAIVLFVASVTLAAGASAQQTKAKSEPHEVKVGALSATDTDGYILFTYSLADGERVAAGAKLPTIAVTTAVGSTTFVFEKHVLSCGTVMTGRITKTSEGAATRYQGSFSVSNNSFEISRLVGDYAQNGSSKDAKGYLTVNDRKIDIGLF